MAAYFTDSKNQHPYHGLQDYPSPYFSDLTFYHFLLGLSASAILASFLFLKHGSHMPASGPLHLPAPQPVTLFPCGLSPYLFQSLFYAPFTSKTFQIALASPILPSPSPCHSQHSLDAFMLYFSPQHPSDIENIYLFGCLRKPRREISAPSYTVLASAQNRTDTFQAFSQ